MQSCAEQCRDVQSCAASRASPDWYVTTQPPLAWQKACCVAKAAPVPGITSQQVERS